MNYFWGNIFDYFKDRRLAGVFFGALLALIGLLPAGWLLYQFLCENNLAVYLLYPLTIGVLVFLFRLAQGISRALARRRDRYKSSPLSRDELSKARSKLMRAKH